MPNNDWDILQNFSRALINNLDGTFSVRVDGGTGGGLTEAEANLLYIRLDGTSAPSAVIPFDQGIFLPNNESIALGNAVVGDPAVSMTFVSASNSFHILGRSMPADNGVNFRLEAGTPELGSGTSGGVVYLYGGIADSPGLGVDGWVNIGDGTLSPSRFLSRDDLFIEGELEVQGIITTGAIQSGTFYLYDTNQTNTLSLVWNENDTVNRTLNFLVGGANRSITLSGNPTLSDWFDQSVKTSASPTFVRATLSQTTGTAPFTISSTTLVTNLNADLLDGFHASDFQAGGLIELVTDAGTNTPFNPATDTDADRGTALLAAQTAAASGDTIYVGPGTYSIGTSLGKNGVNWWFAPGAIVTSATVNIWGDGGSALTFKVAGSAIFNNTGNVANNDNIGRFTGASNIDLQFHSGTASQGRAFITTNAGITLGVRWTGTITTLDGAFDNVGGTMLLYGYRVVSTGFAIEMDGDLTIAYIDEIESTGTNPIELASQGIIRVYYSKIIAPNGELIALNSTGTNGLYIFDSVFVTDQASPVSGAAVLKNVSTTTNQIAFVHAYQPLDATLTSLAAYNTNGLLTQTAANTFTGRTITGTANQVVVTNGDGVSGNPTLSLPQNINAGASPTFVALSLTGDSSQIVFDSDAGSGITTTLQDSAATSGKVLTLPNVTSTLAALDLAQTWSTLQTFQAGITLNTAGSLTITDRDVVLGTTTGTKFGTATSQKLGFFNATPVVQITGATDVLASLVTLGLRAASSNPPLNLGSGTVTAGIGTFSGAVSGTTGTFSAAVSGTTGTFSGLLRTTGGAVIQATSFTPYTSGYELSIQSAGTNCYLEILNNAGTNTGAFFGMETNAFAIYNWQLNAAGSGAAPINFYAGFGSPLLHSIERTENGGSLFNSLLKVLTGTATGEYSTVGGTIISNFGDSGNVGTGEDDLYSKLLAANVLATNGDHISARYAGIFVGHATATRQLKCHFGGTVIYDSTALAVTANTDWDLDVLIQRESSSIVRCTARFVTSTGLVAAIPCKYTTIGGLNLAGTITFKITGAAAGVGAATNDIVAKLQVAEHGPDAL